MNEVRCAQLISMNETGRPSGSRSGSFWCIILVMWVQNIRSSVVACTNKKKKNSIPLRVILGLWKPKWASIQRNRLWVSNCCRANLLLKRSCEWSSYKGWVKISPYLRKQMVPVGSLPTIAGCSSFLEIWKTLSCRHLEARGRTGQLMDRDIDLVDVRTVCK